MATYYIASNGSDNYNGISTSTPWQSIAKVNASMGSMSAGDEILFRKGDTFYGTITIARSGSSGNPMVLSSYGDGEKPIITGLTTLEDWTLYSGSIYYATVTSPESQTNMVIVDDTNVGMGRYPNIGTNLTYTTATSNTITDPGIGDDPDWEGAEIVISKQDWILDRCLVTDHTGDVFTFTNLGTTTTPVNNRYYFIQNDLRCVTETNEWYHDLTTSRFYIYGNPSLKDIKIATLDYLLYNSSYDYITIDGLEFAGSIKDTLYHTGGDYLNIQNCTIKYAGRSGICFYECISNIINNNIITRCNGHGVEVISGTYFTTSYNNISYIGVIPGQYMKLTSGGYVYASGGSHGVYYNTSTTSNNYVKHNIISYTGLNGIHASSITKFEVEHNFVTHSAQVQDDGGGIYCANGSAVRLINENIFLYAGEGAPADIAIARGIYIDSTGSNVTITNNTVAHCREAGIHIHSGSYNTIIGNTIYNNLQQIEFQKISSPVTNSSVNDNYFIAKTSTQRTLLDYGHTTGEIANFGAFDYNYYARPINEGNTMWYASENRSFSDWQTLTSQDSNSSSSLFSVGSTNHIHFIYNASIAVMKHYSLDSSFVDITNTQYGPGTMDLSTWKSMVLFGAGTITDITDDSSTVDASLMTNIQAYWKLDETSGSTVYDSVGTSDASVFGAEIGSTDSILGRSVNFDTSTDYLVVSATNNSIVNSSDAFSVSMWVKLTTLPSVADYNSVLIRFNSTTSPGLMTYIGMQRDGGDYFFFSVYSDDPCTHWLESKPGDVSVNKWYHLVGVCNGRDQSTNLYLNGENKSYWRNAYGKTGLGSILQPNSTIIIGNIAVASNRSPDAVIDEIAYWDRALSAEDVSLLYNNGNGLTYPFEDISTFIPTVTTTAITDISTNTATGGGNVTSDGSAAVTARGICWDTTSNPTISSADGSTSNGSGVGVFDSSLTGLDSSTHYYVRAYAVNSVGVGYGSNQEFNTLQEFASDSSVFYIDPTGNDSTGNGSSSNPWKSLYYACTQVTDSSSTIHVNSGIYYEPSQCVLSVGVNIQGEGASSKIISTYSSGSSLQGAIHLASTVGTTTNGNQSISYIALDGSNLTSTTAIYVGYRNTVEIHNCTIENFLYRGIFFYISGSYSAVFATGNKVYDSSINNSSNNSAGSAGCIRMLGQDGLEIYGNTIDMTFRTAGQNGNTMNSSKCKRVKIYNNIFRRNDYEADQWNFFFELWDYKGDFEYYDNIHYGLAKVSFGGEYNDIENGCTFGAKIYNNQFLNEANGDRTHLGYTYSIYAINIEGDQHQKVYVYNNYIQRYAWGIELSTPTSHADPLEGYWHHYWQWNGVYVYYNIIENVGYADISYTYGIITIMELDEAPYYGVYNDIVIANNIMTGNNGGSYPGYRGIHFNCDGSFNGLTVINNIVYNFSNYATYFMEQATGDFRLNNIDVIYNNFYSNGTNSVYWDANIEYTNRDITTGNITGNPLFTGGSPFGYELQEGSPCINTGIDISIGIAYTDYAGNAVSSPPEMGVYEYIEEPSTLILANAFLLHMSKYLKLNGKFLKY